MTTEDQIASDTFVLSQSSMHGDETWHITSFLQTCQQHVCNMQQTASELFVSFRARRIYRVIYCACARKGAPDRHLSSRSLTCGSRARELLFVVASSSFRSQKTLGVLFKTGLEHRQETGLQQSQSNYKTGLLLGRVVLPCNSTVKRAFLEYTAVFYVLDRGLFHSRVIAPARVWQDAVNE